MKTHAIADHKAAFVEMFSFAVLVLLLIAVPAAWSQGVLSDVIDIGSRRELMIDDTLIDSLSGSTSQRLHHPVRREIVLVGDQPWEGSGCNYYTVFQDEDRYRMYYHAWHIALSGDSQPLTIAYAESNDGIHWKKPNLGLFECNGSTNNNIVIKTIDRAEPHDFSPFKDPRPGVRPDARYKGIGLCSSKENWGLWAFKSHDAIHWQPIQESAVFAGHAFDTQNIAFWSETERCFVLYYRMFSGSIRSIGRAVSDDFITWTDQGELHFSNRSPAKLQQYYTNQIKPYYRAPHIYIGFPAVYVDRGWTPATDKLPGLEFRHKRAKMSGRYGSAVTDTLITVSRDGRNFHTWDESFIRPGLRTGHNWAYGDNYTAWHVVETNSTFDDAPSELSLYATESYFTGKTSRLRRYTLRLDGFASVFAPITGGELLTRPLRFKGAQLRLNFATAAPGSIRVELQTAEGQAVPGYNLADCKVIYGDALDRIVQWHGGSDVSGLAGIPVRLRVELKDAHLFAFRFVDAGIVPVKRR